MDATYTLLSALKGQQVQMEAVSNNLANVNTPGFKKDQVMFKEYFNKFLGQDLESEEERFSHDEFISPFARGSGSFVKTDQISPLMHKGDFKSTDNPYDLAIQSDGFFTVDTISGAKFTRNGSFLRDGKGFLVTSEGDHVLGEKGPIKIVGKDFAVGSDGKILVDNQLIDTLLITRFQHPSRLTKVGNSYWIPGSPQQKPIKSDNIVIHQGVIEGSNVDSIQEMVKMITINRAFEASQRAMRAGDELDEKSITISQV